MSDALHLIPVPVGWSIEQSWEAIRRGDELEHPSGEPTWALIETSNGRFQHTLETWEREEDFDELLEEYESEEEDDDGFQPGRVR